MYQKTEIHSCDRCGEPSTPQRLTGFHAPLTPAEKTAMREELEAIARKHFSAHVQSMMGGIANMVNTPSGFNLAFCDRCLALMMPDLATWRATAVEQWLRDRQHEREDAETPA